MVDPVLKWAGGKRQLLDAIYARFPAAYDRYHEPFFGGGAVFFDLEPAAATINDTNPRLVTFYEVVRDHPDALIDRLHAFDDPTSDPDETQEFHEATADGTDVDQYYYQQRARFNRRPYAEEPWPRTDRDRIEEAALLLYLNRTCYNGLYRENSRGGFNVPIGRYADPNWVVADRIRAASRVLESAAVHSEDFEYVHAVAKPGDLVYVDPPYQPMSATASFAEYSAAGFERADQRRLLETVRELDDAGVHFVLSNSGVTYDLYDDAGFFVETEAATRNINSDETARGAVDEIIATNVPPAERATDEQASIGDF